MRLVTLTFLAGVADVCCSCSSIVSRRTYFEICSRASVPKRLRSEMMEDLSSTVVMLKHYGFFCKVITKNPNRQAIRIFFVQRGGELLFEIACNLFTYGQQIDRYGFPNQVCFNIVITMNQEVAHVRLRGFLIYQDFIAVSTFSGKRH